MAFNRIYAIPDVHGRLDLLTLALQLLKADGWDAMKDLLVFTGDIIDRGPNVKGCLDTIIQLVATYPDNVIMLRGNHEDFAFQHYILGESLGWSYNGMYQTLASYENNQMTDEHIKFIASRPYSLEVQGFFFAHAPVPREKARAKGTEYTVNELTWTYFGIEGERKGGLMDKHAGPLSECGVGKEHLVGICGHIHRLGSGITTVRIFPNYRMLDAGCGCAPHAPLAVHECVENRTFYADPKDLTSTPKV